MSALVRLERLAAVREERDRFREYALVARAQLRRQALEHVAPPIVLDTRITELARCPLCWDTVGLTNTDRGNRRAIGRSYQLRGWPWQEGAAEFVAQLCGCSGRMVVTK